MIDKETKFRLLQMQHTVIDHDYIRLLSNQLLDAGVWIEDIDLAVGSEAKENENIEKVFHRICQFYHLEKLSIEEFKDKAISHYSGKIVGADGDPKKIMQAVYQMVGFIQYDLGYQKRDTKCVGDAAGIEDFVGPYYEYEEYRYYQISEEEVTRAKSQDIAQVTEAANKTLHPTAGLRPSVG